MQWVLLVGVSRDILGALLGLLVILLHQSILVIAEVSVLASVLQICVAVLVVKRKFAIGRAPIDWALCKALFVAAIPFAAIPVYYLATYSLNTLILSFRRPISEVGAFGAATNIVTVLIIIPTVFTRAVFPVFARLFSREGKDSLREAYSRSYNYLLILGLAVSIGVFVTGDRIIRLIYGVGFEQAVPAIKILAWGLMPMFLGQLNGNFLLATGREKLFMVTEGVIAALTVVLSFVLTIGYGYLGSCVAIVSPIVLGFVFYSVWCHRLNGQPLPIRTTGLAILAGLLMGACSYIALQRQVNMFAVMLVVGPLAYGLALFALRVVTRDDIALLRQALRLG
jgi:O-antigen/teichoic acid export membrane protein